MPTCHPELMRGGDRETTNHPGRASRIKFDNQPKQWMTSTLPANYLSGHNR